MLSARCTAAGATSHRPWHGNLRQPNGAVWRVSKSPCRERDGKTARCARALRRADVDLKQHTIGKSGIHRMAAIAGPAIIKRGKTGSGENAGFQRRESVREQGEIGSSEAYLAFKPARPRDFAGPLWGPPAFGR